MLKFFNSLTRKLEPFRPPNPKQVRVYTCGPTVYNVPHIGNYRTFLWEDVLVRFLRFKGYRVTHVMNITDVDDKTIAGSTAKGVSLSEFTAPFKQKFFSDLKRLNAVPADYYPEATAHIPQMVKLISTLLKKGVAYRASDQSIYFSIAKFPKYGKLSKFKLKKLKAGARVSQDEYEKKQAQDFALWKAYDAADGSVYWDTELGRGRPAWHIECSAMSVEYLGQPFDIHAGGIDNLFPHHENEIAQSEGATGKPLAQYWLHAKHLLVNGEKMAKSKGNFLTLDDVKAPSEVVRFVLIANHYRKGANFTYSELSNAQTRLEKMNALIQHLLETASLKQSAKPSVAVSKLASGALSKFELGLDSDLNVPKALLGLNELVRKTNALVEKQKLSKADAQVLLKAFGKMDSVLGVLSFEKKIIPKLDAEIESLIQKREAFRVQKKWVEADAIRDELLKRGIELLDTPLGPKWKKKNS